MAEQEQLVARERSYADIDFGFRANPITGDISLKRDVEAVKQSVVNILSTNRGERPFDPDFGANIRNQLFENFDPIVKQLIDDDIRSALRNYEPRVRVLNVNVNAQPDRNSIDITIEFQIQSPEQTVTTVSFSVERLR